MKIKEKFAGIFLVDKKLATRNMIKGMRSFGEQVIRVEGKEYRLWEPSRSKLAAAIMKGIKSVPIKKGNVVLYLGAAHGMTPSYMSDIVGREGLIYAVEFSERCFKELIPLCKKRKNIAPILADARLMKYEWIEEVDAVYCDIAQPDATEVAVRNCKKFLKKMGYLLLAIKTRSIDVTRNPKKICKQEIEKLKQAGFEIIDWKMLEPWEDAHGFVIARMK